MRIINGRNYIIFFIIIILIFTLFVSNIGKNKEYSENYKYFDHYIVVKIYENKNVFGSIDNIYIKYSNLEKEQIKKEIEKYIKKKYTNANEYIKSNEYNEIVSAYATSEVVKYLKQKNIDKYLISDDGDITVGKHYADRKYNVSVMDPKTNKVIEIVELQDESMVTRKNEMYDSVVVIADDVNEATIIANVISLMEIEEGRKIVKEHKLKALWYKDGKVEKENF